MLTWLPFLGDSGFTLAAFKFSAKVITSVFQQLRLWDPHSRDIKMLLISSYSPPGFPCFLTPPISEVALCSGLPALWPCPQLPVDVCLQTLLYTCCPLVENLSWLWILERLEFILCPDTQFPGVISPDCHPLSCTPASTKQPYEHLAAWTALL